MLLQGCSPHSTCQIVADQQPRVVIGINALQPPAGPSQPAGNTWHCLTTSARCPFQAMHLSQGDRGSAGVAIRWRLPVEEVLQRGKRPRLRRVHAGADQLN